MELLKNELAKAKQELKKYQGWIDAIHQMKELNAMLLSLLDEYNDQKWRLENEIKSLNNQIKEAEKAA